MKAAFALGIAGALALIVIASGCVQQGYHSPDTGKAVLACGNSCQNARANGVDLSSGPCIGNPIRKEGPKWVCDIAHSPRAAIDDLQENQCSAFREGKARNFVELDENCGLVRAYEA
ncbi:MAG: hypothetical protein WC602_05000 [archaeon]